MVSKSEPVGSKIKSRNIVHSTVTFSLEEVIVRIVVVALHVWFSLTVKFTKAFVRDKCCKENDYRQQHSHVTKYTTN